MKLSMAPTIILGAFFVPILGKIYMVDEFKFDLQWSVDGGTKGAFTIS